MSPKFGTTPRGRVARVSPGRKAAVQPGRASALGVDEPGQLMGPRARTRIRPGGATPRRTTMDGVSVGMDVSKATVVVAVEPTGERWTSETTVAAIDVLVARVQTLAPAVVVVEATGGYERALVAGCAAAGLPVAVVNPRQVRAFAQALGHTAKTDAIDAAVLAAFGARVQPEPRPIPDAATQALAAF